jgi:hypothetical protein
MAAIGHHRGSLQCRDCWRFLLDQHCQPETAKSCGVGLSSFGKEAANAAIRNPQSTMAFQMVGIAQRVIPTANFGKSLAGQFRQGTDDLWHVTLPVHGHLWDQSLPEFCGTKRLRLLPENWWVACVSSSRRWKQKKAQTHCVEQSKRKYAPFRPLASTIEIGRSNRHQFHHQRR